MEKQEKSIELTENRAFLEMRKAAKERLAHRAPEEISKNARIPFDAQAKDFHLNSLGYDIHISYPDYEIQPNLAAYHHLVILHYMDLADGTPMGSQLMTFRELKDGMIRGSNFDRQCETALSTFLGRHTEGEIVKICEALGAEMTDSNADLCAVFPFLPQFPVTLKLWFPDDEMAGSGRMLLNESADHYLTVEDAVTVGTLILDAVVKPHQGE